MQEALQEANYRTSKNDLICVIQYWNLMKTFLFNCYERLTQAKYSSLQAAVTHSVCRAEDTKATSAAHMQPSGEGDQIYYRKLHLFSFAEQ